MRRSAWLSPLLVPALALLGQGAVLAKTFTCAGNRCVGTRRAAVSPATLKEGAGWPMTAWARSAGRGPAPRASAGWWARCSAWRSPYAFGNQGGTGWTTQVPTA